jgi:two-component system, NtrC family, sensor kinase
VSSAPKPLAQKLILPLTAMVVVVAGIFGVLRVATLERALREAMILGADQLSRGVASATWHAMLADNRQDAYDVMETIARQPGISRIRIFNKEGRIMFSTAPETAQVVDKKAEACVLCHASAEPLVRVETPSRARVFRAADGQRRLAMITPIYNEPSCSAAACHAHPESQHVLGVLDIAMDLGAVDRQVGDAKKRLIAHAGIEVILISIFLVVLLHLFVTRPIHRLIEANEAVSRMDLERSIEIGSNRELWALARSFNEMRERLREAVAAIHRAAHELEAKVAERTEQLHEAHRRLLQADRLASLGQLAASVAHEINNPLSGVLNFSALMARILQTDGIPPGRVAEFRGYLQSVTEQTARAGRIVSDLLAFSRRLRPQRAPADLNSIVRSTVALVSHKLGLMNVAAELQLAEALPLVSCDTSQVQQVVLNLVMNGAEATRPRGQGRIAVATRLAEARDAVVLTVEDDGEGIAEEARARIFEPFFTTKDDGKGVGLGLAVVYGIVESHGGQIELRSAPGGGTCFEVRLPISEIAGAHDRRDDPEARREA